MKLHEHLPVDLRDTDVVSVEVVGDFQVRATHRDCTEAVHVFEPEEFAGIAEPLRDPAAFATAGVIDGCLAWELPGGRLYDVAPDSLWLHARGHCDGSCGTVVEVER